LEAAQDRQAAAGDRDESARERAISSIDELTGAYRRDSGTVELEREMARAKRTGSPLVLAFVDVDGLKKVNDSRGHAAGDFLLRRTVDSMRAHLRSYDPIVRYGGDEFVCALLDIESGAAEKRFEAINADLKASDCGSVTVGLAELRASDSLAGLLARADDALLRGKHARVS
jgi:diguanylate cyclase (GGDEF)-like protein